ncbi:unnamed protein product [Peniophora sp. CBMAI 1063]|nr:unnamed protein product [Peniophora sp. CBMAI 1063]
MILTPLSPQDDGLLQELVRALQRPQSHFPELTKDTRCDSITILGPKPACYGEELNMPLIQRPAGDTRAVQYRGAAYLPRKYAGVLVAREADLARLSAGGLLNDVVVNLVLRMWWSDLGAKKAARLHIFSSHFLPRFRKAGFSAIANWFPQNLFDKPYLIFPVHEGGHWYLAVACIYPFVKIFTMDSFSRDGAAVPHQETAIRILNFLRLAWDASVNGKYAQSVELLNKRGNTSVSYQAVKVPLQPNDTDCGIYLLHFARIFAEDPEICLRECMHSTTTYAPLWERRNVVDLRVELATRISELRESL